MFKFFSPAPVLLNYGITLVRIVTGVLLIYHGKEVFDPELMDKYTGWFIEKNYSSPALWAYLHGWLLLQPLLRSQVSFLSWVIREKFSRETSIHFYLYYWHWFSFLPDRAH
jgi:hypothetical protein